MKMDEASRKPIDQINKSPAAAPILLTGFGRFGPLLSGPTLPAQFYKISHWAGTDSIPAHLDKNPRQRNSSLPK